MVNDCIRIGLEENVSSMKSLSLKAYHQLDNYDVATCYRLTAVSKAAGLLRNYRKAAKKANPKQPYVRHSMLVDCYGFRIQHGKLRLPIRAREYFHIALNEHTLAVLARSKPDSVTLTVRNFSIAFSKETATVKPAGYLGIDRNLDNITAASTTGEIERYDLSEPTRIKARYRHVRSKFTRNDARICERLFAKYGRRQRDRVQQRLHRVSKAIVQEAKEKRYGIALEKLTGIRRLYQRANGQGRNFRARMNSWSFAELQGQIDYKARWEGLSVIYVNPAGTSVKCSRCGSRMINARKPEENRQLRCTECGLTVDRDVNAALNLAARGLRFRPIAPASEAMVQEHASVVSTLKVDAGELTRRPTNE